MSDPRPRSLALSAFVAFLLVGALVSSRSLPVVIGSVAIALAAAVSLRATGPRLVAAAAVCTATVTVLCSGSSSNVGWFAICVIAGWCAFQSGPVVGAALGTTAWLVFGAQWYFVDQDPGWAAWMAGTLFTVVSCLLVRRQYELIDELHRAQVGLADRARTDERARISRELHDVIGHSLTVSLLHVISARLAIEDEPDVAIAALDEAERLGRQSLTEVRQVVGLVRDGDGAPVGPTPGLDQIPALVDGFRGVGARITYETTGDSTWCPTTLGATAYRIVQEALTNVVRHAPGADATVDVAIVPDHAVVTVDSTGSAAEVRDGGIGLHSMRERAQALGGTFDAGPSPTGWHVRAVLPRQPAHLQPGL